MASAHRHYVLKAFEDVGQPAQPAYSSPGWVR